MSCGINVVSLFMGADVLAFILQAVDSKMGTESIVARPLSVSAPFSRGFALLCVYSYERRIESGDSLDMLERKFRVSCSSRCGERKAESGNPIT